MRKTFRRTVVGTVLAVFLAFGAAPAAEPAPEGERWAVIIGINDYQDLGKLTTARNDAKAMARVLVENAGYAENRVILLTDDAAEPQNRPTLAAMRKRIENTVTFTEPQDTLLVFFSGHGIIVDGRGYLVPMDGDARNVVSLDWVKDVLSKARAKSKVLILDACHAGSAAKGVGGIAPSLVAGAGGLVMLLSSAADQVSYPDEATGLSVFSKHLVEGLSGAADANADKAVTFAEVAVYVKRRLKDWYVETGKVQTPVILPEALPAMILAHCNGKRPPTPGVRPESPATRPLAFRVPSGFRAKAGTAAEPYTKTGWAKEIVHEATGIELVFIPAGEFLMGSPASEAQRDDDETQHRVTISRPFYMGKYEVAQGEWQRVMGSNPSYFKGSDRLPVHEGSWADCQSFCQSFCRKFGVSVRLPTESEWEYACRASTKTAFHTGATISRGTVNYDADNAYAKGLIGVHGGKVMDVGRFQANGWGLYDMHGNADEWCADWYGEYPLGPVTDPAGPDSGAKRVLRGGDWTNSPKYCRSANRNGFAPNGHYLGIGFRVVLEFE